MDLSHTVKIEEPKLGARGSLNLLDLEGMMRTALHLPKEDSHIYNGLVHLFSHWKTLSRGVKNPDSWGFLMRLLLTRPGENNGIVERNTDLSRVGGKQCRMTNPITALKDLSEWERGTGHRLAELKRMGWRVETFTVRGGYVDTSHSGWVDEIHAFWNVVKLGLARITRNRRAVVMWGHEASVASLHGGTLHPHTHVVILSPGKESMRERVCSVFGESHVGWDGPVRTLSGLTRYLFALNTPEEAYRVESEWAELETLNRKAWDWVENMRWLMSGVRRIGSMGLGRKKSSLPSAGVVAKIKEEKVVNTKEKNYVYETHGRLCAGNRSRVGGRNSQGTTGEDCKLSRCSGHGSQLVGGLDQRSHSRESELQGGIAQRHVGGGSTGGSDPGCVQGSRGSNEELHGRIESGELGKNSHNRGIAQGIETTHTGGLGTFKRIHGRRENSGSGCGKTFAWDGSGPGTWRKGHIGGDALRCHQNGLGKLVGGKGNDWLGLTPPGLGRECHGSSSHPIKHGEICKRLEPNCQQLSSTG
jgi:hypothetical protein